MTSSRPIEIVGGGLAGLSLGLALRRADVPVTVFETGTYPRHRVCGEFITGLDPTTTERLGLAPLISDALVHREVAWFIQDNPTRLQRLPAPALGLSRHTLDERLASAFTTAGGSLRTQTRVTDPTTPPGRIFASGRRRGRSTWLGLKVHALDLHLDHDLELHLGNEAYLGLSRIENQRVNLCGLFRLRRSNQTGPELLLAYLRSAGLDALAERLASVRFDPDSFCAVAGVCFDRRVPAATEIRLGDQCAMIPPFTGNGMAMAFQSAAAALDPLLAYSRDGLPWAHACAAVQLALRRRFRLRLAFADLLHPFLLQPSRQRWLAALSRSGLLPLRPLYSALH